MLAIYIIGIFLVLNVFGRDENQEYSNSESTDYNEADGSSDNDNYEYYNTDGDYDNDGDGDNDYDYEFKEDNENKTVNKVHQHHDVLIALFGSKKLVSSSVYRKLRRAPTCYSIAQVKLDIKRAMANEAKSTNLTEDQRTEISEVIDVLDEKISESSESNLEAWFMRTLTDQWDKLAPVLPANRIEKYLSDLAKDKDERAWRCRDGYLVNLWKDIVNSYHTSCYVNGEKCSDADLKTAIKSLVHIAQALLNVTVLNGGLYDAGGISAKNKAGLLYMISQERNRVFATKTLGGVQQLEDMVQRILCSELTLQVIEAIFIEFTEQPIQTKLGVSVPYMPFVSNVDELLTLVEIQTTLGQITRDVASQNVNTTRSISASLPNLGRNILDSYMELVDTAVNIHSTDVWAQMSLEDVNEKLHHLLLSNEQYVGTLSDIILAEKEENYTLEKNSLSVSMSRVKFESNSETVAQFQYEDTQIWTDDMGGLDDDQGDDLKVYALRYKSWSYMIKDILTKHYNLTTINSTTGNQDEFDVPHSRHVRSIINSASEITSNKSFIGKGGIVSLTTRHKGVKKSIPVTYWIGFDDDMFTNISELPRDSSFYHCLSCEYLAEETITWESRGCHVVTADERGVTCKCNHTTNFAAFMMPVEMAFEITEKEKEILATLSIAGSILSVVGLLLSLTIFFLVRNLVRNERLKAHVNLSIALLVVYTLFLPEDIFLENDSMCVTATVLLHYFLLAAFMWMLIEGIFLYLYVVQVFLSSKITSYNWMYIVGWLVPAGIVAISAGYGIPNNAYVMMASTPKVETYSSACPEGTFKYPPGKVDERQTDRNDQDTYERCWLSTESGMIWSFLGPAVLVLAFNTIIMCKTLQICVKSLKTSSQVRSDNKIYKRPTKSSPPSSHSASSGHNGSSVGHFSSESYDHLHGEPKRLYTKATKPTSPVVSTSPCLLQVTTEEEEECKKEMLDNNSNDSFSCTTENNTTKHSNVHSLHVENKDKEEMISRYHSVSGDSTRYTNSRASVVYRNSVSHTSPIQVVRSPSQGSKMPKLRSSDKAHFFQDAKTAVKGAVVLLPILGITWLLGFFTHFSKVLTILFIFLNATQGVAIFIVYCIFNGEVSRAIHRRLARIYTRHQVDAGVRRSSSTTTTRSFLRFGRRRSTVTTSA